MEIFYEELFKKIDNIQLNGEPEWVKASLANKSQYQKSYNESIKNNNSFWKKEWKRITWIKPYKKIKDVKYSKDEVRIKWYEDGTLNEGMFSDDDDDDYWFMMIIDD